MGIIKGEWIMEKYMTPEAPIGAKWITDGLSIRRMGASGVGCRTTFSMIVLDGLSGAFVMGLYIIRAEGKWDLYPAIRFMTAQDETSAELRMSLHESLC